MEFLKLMALGILTQKILQGAHKRRIPDQKPGRFPRHEGADSEKIHNDFHNVSWEESV